MSSSVPGEKNSSTQRLRMVAERRVVDHRREALQRALAPELVDAALDRGRRQRDVLGDVVVGATPVFDQQRKNLTICGIHTLVYCREYIVFGIDNRFVRR